MGHCAYDSINNIDGDRFSKIKSIFVTDATAFVKSKLIKCNGIKTFAVLATQ